MQLFRPCKERTKIVSLMPLCFFLFKKWAKVQMLHHPTALKTTWMIFIYIYIIYFFFKYIL